MVHMKQSRRVIAIHIKGFLAEAMNVIQLGTAGPSQGKSPHDLLRSQAQGRRRRLGCARARAEDSQQWVMRKWLARPTWAYTTWAAPFAFAQGESRTTLTDEEEATCACVCVCVNGLGSIIG